MLTPGTEAHMLLGGGTADLVMPAALARIAPEKLAGFSCFAPAAATTPRGGDSTATGAPSAGQPVLLLPCAELAACTHPSAVVCGLQPSSEAARCL